MLEALRLEHALRQAISAGAAPAVAFGLQVGATRWTRIEGRLDAHAEAPWATTSTPFDLASLTKPLTTLPWIARLVEAGRLDLDTPLGDLVPLTDARLASCPLWRLLNHTSGLPAHRRYYEGLGAVVRRSGDHDGARAAVRRMLSRTAPETPPGEREIYSDLGFLLLEWIGERADAPLATRWAALPHHGPERLHLRPLLGPDPVGLPPADQYAATEICPWRSQGRVALQGEVHDDNAWLVGGVAGHAGLFGHLDAVLDAAVAWRDAARGAPGPDVGSLRPDTVATLLSPRWMHPHGTRLLGWDTPTPGRSTSGQHFGRRAFGHLGFTGCSLWVDPQTDRAMVLLTNRVCPRRDNEVLRPLRPLIHDLAWALADRLAQDGCCT